MPILFTSCGITVLKILCASRRFCAARPLRLQIGYVGQDGILRPIGNRPSDELARARKRQVANLPYIAPDSSSIWLNAGRLQLASLPRCGADCSLWTPAVCGAIWTRRHIVFPSRDQRERCCGAHRDSMRSGVQSLQRAPKHIETRASLPEVRREQYWI
jgi:hypothetical protein